jgi:hypothetical protein
VFVCLDRWIPVVKVITLQIPDCIGEGKIVSVIKLNTTPWKHMGNGDDASDDVNIGTRGR